MGSPRLAQCPGDHQFVLVGETLGILVAVDIEPLNAQRYANAIVGGVGLWTVEKQPHGGYKRLSRPPSTWMPTWGPNGAQSGAQALHGEHSCGVLAKDMRVLDLEWAQKGPQEASATSGGGRAGNRPGNALAGATRAPERPSRAPYATRLRSSPVRCNICDRLIASGEPYTGIQCGTYAWAAHEECP